VRYGTDIEVEILLEAETYRRRIKQISRGGCLALPALPPDLNPHVLVSFRLSESQPPIICRGEIIYSFDVVGTGILFSGISDHISDLITEYFEKN
jgi:hypothetical protein